MVLKALLAKTRSIFRREGLRGVLTRVLPYLKHIAIQAVLRLRFTRRASLVLLTGDEHSIPDLLEGLPRRSILRNRWIGETVVVCHGATSGGERRAHRVRVYTTPEDDLAIVANTGVSLARGSHVLFLVDEELPAWFRRIPRFMRRRTAAALWSATDGTATDPLDAVALGGLLVDRRALFDIGLFYPEIGRAFVTDALRRMLAAGGHVAAVGGPPGNDIQQIATRDETEHEAPRVVYFVNGTDVRGGIRIVFEHCNRLRERGIEAFVASFEEPFQSWFPGLRAPLIAVRDLIPSDVAVATYWTTAPHVARLDCPGYYFIQHDEALFGDQDWWKKRVVETYSLPLEFITISKWLVRLVSERAEREAHLVPNGINRDMFFLDPQYPPTDRVRVLVEGNREITWKGLEEAEEALRDVDVEVWSLGDTGIPSAREFVYPSQDQLRGIYSSCDILFKTSWYEGMPLPHMEAMACGCALVTTDIPGVHDYCVDGWNCLMARPRDVGDLRAKLIRLVEDMELRRKLVENGLRTAEDQFGWDDKIDLLEAIYRKGASQTATNRHAKNR